MKRYVELGFFLFLIAFPILGQSYFPKSPFFFNADYSRFRYDDSTGYVELYYSFYPHLVTFESKGDGTISGFIKLEVLVQEHPSGKVISFDRSLIPLVLKDTTSESFKRTFVSKTAYRFRFGDYILTLKTKDSLGINRSDSLKFPLAIRQFGPNIAVSDIDLCSTIKSSTNKQDPFYKNSLEVVPNPSLLFGAQSNPIIFSYAEIYNLDTAETYTIKTEVFSQSGSAVKQSSKSRKFGIHNAVEANTTNVISLASGRYKFSLSILNKDGTVLSRAEKPFFTHNPHIKSAYVTPTTQGTAELSGMTFNELGEEFRRAKYIATREEISIFDELTTVEARRQFIANFWSEVAKGRLGREPMTRMEYMSRLDIANQRYRALSKQGWASDRGRVFILFGEADEIERFPSSDQNKPYELWHYYRIENGVEFVFVDRSGFGDYMLVHSTKRGELRDDSWQRYLQ